MNVRVILLTFLTFLTVSRVDLLRALSFSPTLTYLIVLALSQIMTFRRLHQEFRLAGESRRLRRPTLRDGYTPGRCGGRAARSGGEGSSRKERDGSCFSLGERLGGQGAEPPRASASATARARPAGVPSGPVQSRARVPS